MATNFQTDVPMAKAIPREELVTESLPPFSVTEAESWQPNISDDHEAETVVTHYMITYDMDFYQDGI